MVFELASAQRRLGADVEIWTPNALRAGATDFLGKPCDPVEIQARITNQIIERLEAGTKPWVKPWRGLPVSRPLRSCGTPYRGMNVFWLWMVADMNGYASPYWMTYVQANKLGGQVRKGEKSTIAIFYKSYSKEVEANEAGEASEESRRVLRAYAVFNADQIEGLPERYHPSQDLVLVEPEGRKADLNAFFGQIPAALRHSGSAAYYEPVADRITMPPTELFTGFDHYYATLAHAHRPSVGPLSTNRVKYSPGIQRGPLAVPSFSAIA